MWPIWRVCTDIDAACLCTITSRRPLACTQHFGRVPWCADVPTCIPAAAAGVIAHGARTEKLGATKGPAFLTGSRPPANSRAQNMTLTSADKVELAAWYADNRRAVPIRPEAGVLVASILVSILGSYATLLVLGRRTSPRGFRNLILLLLAAVCFSAVAVWGMHFVSMISIRLQATPEKNGVQWYMQFSAGMTVMSLFIPLVATSFAFWFLASEAEFIWWRGLISGIIVGLTSECLPCN